MPLFFIGIPNMVQFCHDRRVINRSNQIVQRMLPKRSFHAIPPMNQIAYVSTDPKSVHLYTPLTQD